MWNFRSVVMVMMLAIGQAALADPHAIAPLARDPFEALPEELRRDLVQQPERFLEEVAELIIGHGTGGAINAAGIEQFIGLERARTRAYHLRRLLQADIDGDGRITQGELAALQHVSSARQRGLLELDHRRADANRDGTASAREMWQMAENKAHEALNPTQAAGYRAIMGFDLDGSGGVTLDEVIHAVAALRGEVT